MAATASGREMTDNERVAIALAVLGIIIAWGTASAAAPATTPAPREGTVTLDPIEQVGPIGNVDPGNRYDPNTATLCKCAPLGSFGPACKGYTWIDDPGSLWLGISRPVELRTRIPLECGSLR